MKHLTWHGIGWKPPVPLNPKQEQQQQNEKIASRTGKIDKVTELIASRTTYSNSTNQHDDQGEEINRDPLILNRHDLSTLYSSRYFPCTVEGEMIPFHG
jgi:hypothetical protein